MLGLDKIVQALHDNLEVETEITDMILTTTTKFKGRVISEVDTPLWDMYNAFVQQLGQDGLI